VTQKVLIANRGEISLRIARACRELGLRAVAVYSEADRDAPHVLGADEAYLLGPAPARESYLSVPRLLDAARRAGASLVHPGYGFLSENPGFARAITEAGLVFVGPSADSIDAMGSKALARQRVSAAGVPCVPGYDGEDQTEERFAAEAARIGFPILVKPADGGGGKGMTVVDDLSQLREAVTSAQRLAQSAFGSSRLVLERYLRRPRHVEVQVFGDARGEVVHVYERECSVQRRHQKIIEESPCPVMTQALREKMTQAAVAAAKSVHYRSAGTVEFLLDEDNESFYFLEMNTRLQVEHPVTEWIAGVDLVSLQLRLALGEPLALSQRDFSLRGHAVEARVYAEDVAAGFLPSAGPVLRLSEPAGPFVRVDSGIREGYEVPVEYDPMLAKVSAWGETRGQAIARLLRALREYNLLGVATNIDYLCAILEHPAYQRGETSTRFLQDHLANYQAPAPSDDDLFAAIASELVGQDASPAQSRAPGSSNGHDDLYSPWRTLRRAR
jgi:acetyl-CoA carboxylase biotin carboxylase subunit